MFGMGTGGIPLAMITQKLCEQLGEYLTGPLDRNIDEQ